MSDIRDSEFGDIKVRRYAQASRVKLSLGTDGSLRVSAPRALPLFMIKQFVRSSRSQIRELMTSQQPKRVYLHGDQIGKSHALLATKGAALAVARKQRRITVTLPDETAMTDHVVQSLIRKEVRSALRMEAKAHLTHRLAFLAQKHGFHYERVRFTHAGTRWGSCSSSGTISLNIALMALPFELIDYVLIHELSHTKEMNHSSRFWATVAKIMPDYKKHRSALKRHSPTI